MEELNAAGVDGVIPLSFFTDIGKAITSARTLHEVFHAVMDKIGTTFAPANWSLLVRKHDTGELRFVVVIGADAEQYKGRTLKRGQGIAGWIAENGVPLIIEDVSQDKRFDASMDEKTGFKTKSIIGVPLKSRTRVFGVIELINKVNGKKFTPFELQLLSTIADYAAIAIEKLYYIQALRKSALTDPLTKLHNRRLLLPFLSREMERAHREKSSVSLLFIDVDRFKDVNDTHGHDVGDEVLITLAGILKSVLRKSDFLCRWGGDEFVLILPGKERESAEGVRDRIFGDERFLELRRKYGVDLSMGLHEAKEGDAQSVLAAVDKDMYDEKIRRLEQEPEDMPTAFEDALESEARAD